MSPSGVEVVFVGWVEAIPSEVLHELLKEVGQGTGGELGHRFAFASPMPWFVVEAMPHTLKEGQEFEPCHSIFAFMHDLPSERC